MLVVLVVSEMRDSACLNIVLSAKQGSLPFLTPLVWQMPGIKPGIFSAFLGRGPRAFCFGNFSVF